MSFDKTSHELNQQRVLGIWAHPDDEAYLASGLMQRVTASGGAVTVVAVTDGEAGFDHSDPRSSAKRAQARRNEMRGAMAAIGVNDLRFLGIPDGAVADANAPALVASIATIMREVCPDLITTFGPDGITGHEDHIATWSLATAAWLECQVGQMLYAAKTVGWLAEWRELHDEFGVWMTEEPTGVPDSSVDLLVDLDDGEAELKRRVLAGHRSQTEGIAAAFGEDRYLRWVRQEAFRLPTHAELFDVDAAACLANWSHMATNGSLAA